MDVFSYGVLLIEMSICTIPQPGNRRQDVNSIKHAGLKGLIQRCVMDNYKLRPEMSDIINELTQSI
uniref:Serine-threonine/tyrosine-protein kinase catalytic domain-containing protein n=1 Tax=Amphimedon queenslandica TaxID=400682 RepID=A0A1X7SWT7_AMPQE